MNDYDPYWYQHLVKEGAYYIQYVDDIEGLSVSKQRKWQLRNKEFYDKNKGEYSRSAHGLELHRKRHSAWVKRNRDRFNWQQRVYSKSSKWPSKDEYDVDSI